MAPPKHAALASCGDDKTARRHSFKSSEDVIQVIESSFKKFDLDGSGVLNPNELRACVMSLVPLSDPINDIDCICAAIDTNCDGNVSKEEFSNFVNSALLRFPKQENSLDIEEILRTAFKEVIAQSRRQREMVIEAFMKSHQDLKKQQDFTASFRGDKWVHAVYDEFYNEPDPSKDAPMYQVHRIDFLKSSLEKSIKQCKSETIKRPSMPGKSFDLCPDRKVYLQFCEAWLSNINRMESNATTASQ